MIPYLVARYTNRLPVVGGGLQSSLRQNGSLVVRPYNDDEDRSFYSGFRSGGNGARKSALEQKRLAAPQILHRIAIVRRFPQFVQGLSIFGDLGEVFDRVTGEAVARRVATFQ